jgi:hypothetical protein
MNREAIRSVIFAGALAAILVVAVVMLTSLFASARPSSVCAGGTVMKFEPTPDITTYELATILAHSNRAFWGLAVCETPEHPIPDNLAKFFRPT